MTCSNYAGSAPLEPKAVEAVMAVDAEGYLEDQYAHTAEMSGPAEPLFAVGDRVRTQQGDDVEITDVFGAGDGDVPFAYKVADANGVESFRKEIALFPAGEPLAAETAGLDNTTQLALVQEPTYGGWENDVDETPEDEEEEEVVAYEVPLIDNQADIHTRGNSTVAAAVTNKATAATNGLYDHNCTLCPLHRGRSADAVCVAGEGGDADAAIMIIGQTPDEFSGDAGKLLNEYVAAAGLTADNIFITHAIKCQPVKTHKPSKKEMAACSIYLAHEIAARMPQVIVLLGNVPLEAVCGITGITKERGKQQKFSTALNTALALEGYEPYILPTIHPSAVLQSPKGGQFTITIIEDLRLAAAQISGAFAEIPMPWAYEQPPRVLTGPVAYDIETNALPVWDPAFRIRMLSIDDGVDPIIVQRGADVLNGINALHACHGLGDNLVGHNAAGFDRPGIEARTGVNLRNSDDTMLMAHLLDEDGPKKLEDLCVRRLHVRPWKDEVTWTWADGPQTDEEWQLAGLYSARDARYTRLLDGVLRPELEADPALAKYYHTLFLPMARAFSLVERNGIHLSLDKIGYAIGEFTMQKIKAKAALERIVGSDKFNPGSSKQVREVLFERLGLPVQEWTDGDEASTNELSLKKLRAIINEAATSGGEDPHVCGMQLDFIEHELSYREASKMLGTYLEKYADKVLASPDGRLHFWYSMINSVSRSSSDGQQIPRDKRVRNIVSPPPGKVIVRGDFSQMELRMAAHLSQDPELLRVYRSGGDIHRSTASAITGKPEHEVSDKERSDAKPWNFSLLYGADEYTVESILLKDFDIIIPRSETTRTRNAFHDRYSGLQTWYNAVWQETRATGQIRSLTGRVRRLPEIYSTDDHKRIEAFRQAINYTDQEPCFDIAGIGVILAIGYGLKLTWFVHDSMDAECEPHEVDAVKAIFKKIEAGIPVLLKSMFGVDFSVPLPIDVSVIEA
jgi:uracil-DNA glycosylase family 4